MQARWRGEGAGGEGRDCGCWVVGRGVNLGHLHLFIKYPPKYSVSYISKIVEVRSAKVPRKESPRLNKWCGGVEKYIPAHNT